MKTDLRDYSDRELSLMVFNDEYLYQMRRDRKLLVMTLEEFFIYNDDQLTELINDLNEDEEA